VGSRSNISFFSSAKKEVDEAFWPLAFIFICQRMLRGIADELEQRPGGEAENHTSPS
jgi:hypothetical protein